MADNENPAQAATKIGEAVASQFANAANIYGGAFAGSIKALQEYQAKLLHFVQENTAANLQLTQKVLQPRSPSDFVEFLSTHLRSAPPPSPIRRRNSPRSGKRRRRRPLKC